jgi:hypothetical protein
MKCANTFSVSRLSQRCAAQVYSRHLFVANLHGRVMLKHCGHRAFCSGGASFLKPWERRDLYGSLSAKSIENFRTAYQEAAQVPRSCAAFPVLTMTYSKEYALFPDIKLAKACSLPVTELPVNMAAWAPCDWLDQTSAIPIRRSTHRRDDGDTLPLVVRSAAVISFFLSLLLIPILDRGPVLDARGFWDSLRARAGIWSKFSECVP